MTTSRNAILGRRPLIFLWGLAGALFVVLWVYPIGNKLLRLITIAAAVVFFSGALWFWWQKKAVRYPIVIGAALLLGLVLLPSRSVSPVSLQQRYTQALGRYEGTLYVWGGENRRGIDCSGLVRQGMVDATFLEGLATLNGRLIRQSFALRWYDCSAEALKDEYRGFAVKLGETKALHQYDHGQLQPGDFAITSDGVHALAYLGNETWIEADPGAHKVILAKKGDANPWLARPVALMRWSVLVKSE
jgi:hypothetical protein